MPRIGLISPGLRCDDAFFNSANHLYRAAGHNTGNFAFAHAISEHLSPNASHVRWYTDPSIVKERYDLLVMACANQLGPHTDLGKLADWLDEINLPILAIGLGAQSATFDRNVELKDGTRRWLDVLAAHPPAKGPNLLMRGEYSRRQVEAYGHGDRAVIMGCPSNFLNPSVDLPKAIASRWNRPISSLVIAAGLYRWKSLEQAERQLAALLDQADRSLYVVQAQLEMIKISKGEFDDLEDGVLTAVRHYITPTLDEKQFKRWCKKYAWVYSDAASWLHSLTLFDFVVGARFHGVMLAIQAGTPGIVVVHDSRTTEMCQTMGIPYCDAKAIKSNLTLADLPNLATFEADAYASKRRAFFHVYSQALADAKVSIQPKYRSLAS